MKQGKRLKLFVKKWGGSMIEEFYEFLDIRGILSKFMRESNYKVDLSKCTPYYYVLRSNAQYDGFWQDISREWRDYLTYWKEELEAE